MALPAAALLTILPAFSGAVNTLAGGLADGIRNITKANGDMFVNASEGARDIGSAIADRIRRGGRQP
jgi:hypothetical protein